jgi:hypothetical protein
MRTSQALAGKIFASVVPVALSTAISLIIGQSSMSESLSWRALLRDRLAQAGYRMGFDTCACSRIFLTVSS